MYVLVKTLNYMVLSILLVSAASCGLKKDVETRLADAQKHAAQHQYQSAIIELKNALQQEPGNHRVRQMLGSIYVTYGDGLSGEKELNKALSLGATEDDVKVPMVEALLLQGKNAEALNKAGINDAWPTEKKSEMLVLRGRAFLGKGDMAAARTSFSKAAELNPNNSAAVIGLANIAMIDNKLEESEKILSSVGDKDDKVLDKILLQANIALKQQKYTDAEALFEKALSTAQEKNFPLRVLSIRSQLVLVKLTNNKIDDAINLEDQLIKAAPKNPVVLYLNGLIAYKQNNFDKVLENLQQVVAVVPEHLPSMLLLGAANYAKGNYEQANSYLTSFVNRVPTHLHARKLLGVVRLKLNKPGEAMEVLKSAPGEEQKSDAQLLAIIGQAATASGDVRMGVDYLKRAKRVSAESAGISTELARVYLSQGAYDKAINELETVQGDEKNKATVLLVYSYLRKEDFKKAREISAQLIAGEPDNPSWQVVAGGVEMIAGKRNEARAFFNKALQIKPDFILARLNLARMEYEEGRLNEAKEHFGKILVVDPKNVTVLLGMAQIAEQYGDVAETLEWLEKARDADKRAVVPRLVLGRYYFKTGRFEDALGVAKEASGIAKNNAEILRMMAASLVRLQRADEAVTVYRAAIKEEPKNPQWYLDLANVYRGMKRFQQARTALNKAITVDKGFLPAKATLAEIDIQTNNLGSAQKIANDIKAEFPKSSAGYLLLGDVLIRQKKFQEAQQSYLNGFKVEPSILLVNKVFLVSGALNNYDASIKISNQWLNKHPNDTVSRMYLGLAYQALNDPVKAEQEYLKVLDIQPKNVMALNNMAYLLTATDKPKALRYAEQARKLAPNNFAIMDTYGWVLVQNGNFESGIPILKKAAEDSKGNPSIRYHLAAALVKNNQNSEALSILEDITQAGVKFQEMPQAKELLQRVR